MDGGAQWATVHGVMKSRTQLSDFTPSHQIITDTISSVLNTSRATLRKEQGF